MRELKFRSFGKNGMLYSSIDKSSKVKEMVIMFRNGDMMQYIGLKDRKGKEVYEGDIILDNFSIFPMTYCIDFAHFARFQLVLATSGRSSLEKMFCEIEVIGNIYENAYLLKGNDE